VRDFNVDGRKALQESGVDLETVHQKVYSLNCNSIPFKAGEAARRVGRGHSSEEVLVMGMERRASVIRSDYFETTKRLGG
jgi:hypothetical protein